MTDFLNVTQGLAIAEVVSEPNVHATQALVLAESASVPHIHATQALVLVEVKSARIHLTQALVVVEIRPIIYVEVGAADYAGGGGTGSANAQGSAASTTPSTGSGGGGATTTPSAPSVSAATGAGANAQGSAATTTPKPVAARTAMAAASAVQITDSAPAMQGTQGAAAPLPTAVTGASSADGRFSAELYDRAGARVRSTDLELRPAQYSAKAVGGPDQAVVLVEGVYPALWSALNWLAYSLRIKSPLGRVVWEGIVEEVSVTLPALRVGLTIRDLYNRVQVAYTRTLDAEAATESLVTAWAENAASIARYGAKELKASLNDGSLAQAEALRDTILEAAYKPLQTVSIGSGGEPGAELRCIGRWLTLDWEYYAYDAGYVSFEPESTTQQAIGYSYTNDGIGLQDDGISDLDMGLSTLPEQCLIVITGSVGNDSTVTIDGAPETVIADQVTVTSTDIGFDASDDIHSGTVDWSPFAVGEMIEVAGSTLNDGFYWIKKVDALSPGPGDPRIEVSGGGIVDEAAGDSVTITQGHHATVVDGDFTTETPGATITLASHAKIAQRFQAPATWDAQDIVLLLARTGAPADNLVVGLYSEVTGAPGVSLGSVSLAAVDVPDSLNWTECSLATPVALTASAYYWIVVERDGAADDENYWLVGVSDELVSTFVAKLWTGAAWIDHPSSVDMALQVWATVDSAVKAGDVADGGDYVERVAVIEDAGVRVRSFSDGTRRRSEEMQALLDAGDSDAARLLAWFDASGAVNIGVQAADDGKLAIRQDGRLVALPVQEWEAGALPVRRWVRIMDLPPGEIFEQMSPFYVEAATYDIGAMALGIEPLANRNVWEGGA